MTNAYNYSLGLLYIDNSNGRNDYPPAQPSGTPSQEWGNALERRASNTPETTSGPYTAQIIVSSGSSIIASTQFPLGSGWSSYLERYLVAAPSTTLTGTFHGEMNADCSHAAVIAAKFNTNPGFGGDEKKRTDEICIE
jgi:hypothetical protein